MSNWLRAQVSTTIKNPKKSIFEKACANMGYYPDYNEKEVHGAYSSEATEPVYCVLRDKKTKALQTIGFNFRKDAKGETILSVSGDFFHCPFSGEEFMTQLGIQYNTENMKAKMEEMGFNIEETKQEHDKVILVGYRQVA